MSRLDLTLADSNSTKVVTLPYFGKGWGYQVAPFIRRRTENFQNQGAYAGMRYRSRGIIMA